MTNYVFKDTIFNFVGLSKIALKKKVPKWHKNGVQNFQNKKN